MRINFIPLEGKAGEEPVAPDRAGGKHTEAGLGAIIPIAPLYRERPCALAWRPTPGEPTAPSPLPGRSSHGGRSLRPGAAGEGVDLEMSLG